MDKGYSLVFDNFLSEDLGSGDVTAEFVDGRKVSAHIICRQSCTISGLSDIVAFLKGHGVRCKTSFGDGDFVKKGEVVLELRGGSHDILSLERVALNILSMMSGVATLTASYVKRLPKGSKTRVVATRKTFPGVRFLQKKAVVDGGGLPHRMGLYDMVLIKDNHLALFKGDVGKAVSSAKARHGKKYKVEVEVGCLRDAVAAVRAGADIVMFDNMPPSKIREVLKNLGALGLRDGVVFEASGGVSLENVREYAKTGVDWVSVGRLTHSFSSVDFSLKIVKVY